jgi:hypothetical protein
MNRDIYLVIGCYLPLSSLVNFILATRCDTEYFWKLRCQSDFNLNNPLNLSYKLLYKLNYQFSPGKACGWIWPLPENYSFVSKSKIPTTLQLLNLLSRCPFAGEVITYIDAAAIERYYIYHLGKLIYIGYHSENIRIPLEIDIINKYPLQFFANRFLTYDFELNLTLYLSQIEQNQEDGAYWQYQSKFTDWRGETHQIHYDNLIVLMMGGGKYRLKDNQIYKL